MSTLPNDLSTAVSGFKRVVELSQALPFDMAREQYAKAVQFGLIRRSMLDWAKFERQVHLMEQLTMGPLARRV
jgi:hypothetical protein